MSDERNLRELGLAAAGVAVAMQERRPEDARRLLDDFTREEVVMVVIAMAGGIAGFLRSFVGEEGIVEAIQAWALSMSEDES